MQGTSKQTRYNSIFEVVERIPAGFVLTYGLVAGYAGLPHGARQVGYAMHVAPQTLPWQRVVGLSRRGFGRISIADPLVAAIQRQLLEKEGVEFNANDEIDLNRFAFDPILK